MKQVKIREAASIMQGSGRVHKPAISRPSGTLASSLGEVKGSWALELESTNKAQLSSSTLSELTVSLVSLYLSFPFRNMST